MDKTAITNTWATSEGHNSYMEADFQDIFDSEPNSPSGFSKEGLGIGNSEYSDIPRLKLTHETTGYREGITRGKAKNVQKGFDEGFGLGAAIGLRVGMVLGLLEGIAKGSMHKKSEFQSSKLNNNINHKDNNNHMEQNEYEKDIQSYYEEEVSRVHNLWRTAEDELTMSKFFGAEWWDEHGIWRYEVSSDDPKGETTITFHDVARAHPLLKKWEPLVEIEVQKWQLDLKILDGELSDFDMIVINDIGKSLKESTGKEILGGAGGGGESGGITSQSSRVVAATAGDDDLTHINADLNW